MKRKLKTKKSIAKRVRVTARGKFLRRKAGRRHLMSSKNSARRRRLRRSTLISGADHKDVKRMFPYA